MAACAACAPSTSAGDRVESFVDDGVDVWATTRTHAFDT